jgi:exopolysaccharide production protein ExoQ
MPKASMHSFELRRTRASAPMIDKYAIVPIFACAYATIVSPLLDFFAATHSHIQNAEPGLPNRIFWPAMAAVSVVLAMRNYSRLSRLTWPPHIICLLAYVAFAGASVVWAFRPETSFVRFAQQMMLLSSIVLPAMLAARTADLMRGVFLCYAVGAILNVFFVFDNPPSVDGYPGYFLGKNYLGEFSAIALLLALHETLHPGLRRMFGIIVVVIATLLLLWSKSKTALGLALICPLLAGLILTVRKTTRISPAIVLLSIPLCYAVVSSISGFNMNRVSFMLYGDSTFTGRTIIWDFAFSEIARRPLFGWGYQSFWLVGSDAPSVVEAPGFVKTMPNAHNGYYDTMLELGYVGYGFLIVFILATLHAIGRVADRDRGRAWFALAVALYIIIYNYLESFWMRGFEFLWVAFVILALDIGRYWQSSPLTRAPYGSRTPIPGSPGPPRPARMPGLRMSMKAPGLTRSMHENDRNRL